MSSPVGHALAGVAAAWAADLVPGDRAWRTAPPSAKWYERAGDGLTLTCAALAVAPDLDLFFGAHRTVTHSISAVVFVALLSGAMAAGAARPVARVALMCAAAYATHLGLDWLAVDRSYPHGIQLLWPFNRTWFISGWDILPGTERRRVMGAAAMRVNAAAIAQEVVLMAPIVVGLWLIRVKALAGLSTDLARRDHSAE